MQVRTSILPSSLSVLPCLPGDWFDTFISQQRALHHKMNIGYSQCLCSFSSISISHQLSQPRHLRQVVISNRPRPRLKIRVLCQLHSRDWYTICSLSSARYFVKDRIPGAPFRKHGLPHRNYHAFFSAGPAQDSFRPKRHTGCFVFPWLASTSDLEPASGNYSSFGSSLPVVVNFVWWQSAKPLGLSVQHYKPEHPESVLTPKAL